MKRCLLSKTKLEEFKAWCAGNGVATREGKGAFQVLQVQTKEHGWQVIFDRLDAPEHFTINHRLIPTVRAFIAQSRGQNEIERLRAEVERLNTEAIGWRNTNAHQLSAELELRDKNREQAALVDQLRAENAKQAERIAELEAECDDLECERDEAEKGPWPEWAESILKIIRKHSGYDGFADDTDGIDLPEELRELLGSLAAPTAVPDGWAPVPAEVSDEMLEAWKRELMVPVGSSPEARARRAYRAMLAAAPTLPVATGEAEALRKDAALKLAREALGEVQDLIDESYGVYGLHLNGDEAPWSEVEQGGRFERLVTLTEAIVAIDAAMKEPRHA